MGTKIFAFPVRGRRWCFSAIVPDVPTGKYSSVVTISQLWERLQSLPQLTDRVELMESFASNKMQTKWSELGAQPSGSIRHRIYSAGQNLLNRLPAEEQFLKTVPKDTPKVELVFPSSLNPRLVRRRLRHLAHCGTVYHQRLMYGSIALLPFTVLLGILPLPNVVFFWNLFRSHAHWRAFQSSTRLKMLLTEGEAEPSTVAVKGPYKNSYRTVSSQNPSWALTPSKELDSLVKPGEVMTRAIQPSAVAAISKAFDLNSVEVMRWISRK
ncbi:uncharacterized protein [Physcomitrium patens]|uniref:Uncharacterized protein n=2 Tax=Physcomitrium patens TaxID=3218 RepID=A0A2K1JLD7_PHYPA|nr:uncharacterized protein LOC112290434 isoform X1 [Physcomitrium patens]PNR42351.1 hypothetical protein PHYPA_017180 [Physcomitrium patens]|eukprot:XP_024392415.1 uncharacterized protein LOC112290434 isoform X1 [Physcomitrella patens]